MDNEAKDTFTVVSNDVEDLGAEFPWIDQLIETLVESGALTVRPLSEPVILKPLLEASELRLLSTQKSGLERGILYYLLSIEKILGVEEEDSLITGEESRKIAEVRSRGLARACGRLWGSSSRVHLAGGYRFQLIRYL